MFALLRRMLERLVSFTIGVVCVGLTLDVAFVAMVAEGRLKSALGLVCFALVCATTYWVMVPRELSGACRKQARRAVGFGLTKG